MEEAGTTRTRMIGTTIGGGRVRVLRYSTSLTDAQFSAMAASINAALGIGVQDVSELIQGCHVTFMENLDPTKVSVLRYNDANLNDYFTFQCNCDCADGCSFALGDKWLNLGDRPLEGKELKNETLARALSARPHTRIVDVSETIAPCITDKDIFVKAGKNHYIPYVAKLSMFIMIYMNRTFMACSADNEAAVKQIREYMTIVQRTEKNVD